MTTTRTAHPRVQRVLDELEKARPQGTDWKARCPAHDDQNPSLSVAEGDDGRVLLHCHAGCATEDILPLIGMTMADLGSTQEPGLPKKLTRANRPTFSTSEEAAEAAARASSAQIEQVWEYQDAKNNHVMSVVRLNPKSFRPVSSRPGGWTIGDPPGDLPLYRLPQLSEASQVFVAEGEKCASAVRLVTSALERLLAGRREHRLEEEEEEEEKK